MLNRDVTKFLELLDSVGGCYEWATIAFVALRRNPTEPWAVMHGGMSFEVFSTDFQKVSHRYETTHILAVRKSVKVRSLNRLKKSIAKGTVTVGSDSASLAFEQHGPSFFFTDGLSFEEVAGLRQPTLFIRGKNTHQLLQDIGLSQQDLIWELKSSDQPFDSIEDLLVTVGLVASVRADVTTITAFAQAPVLVTNSSSVEHGKANILAICSTKASLPELKFGYRFLSDQTWQRGVVDRDALTCKLGKASRLTECSFSMAINNASSMQVFASYGKSIWHQWWVFDPMHLPNARHAVFSTIDADLGRLRSLLNPLKSRDGDDFDRGIHILFYLLGFVTCYSGKTSGLTDGPDLLAHTSKGNCLVIENTISTLNNNSKLAKLIGRTNQVRQRLSDAKSGHLRVCPVIITAMSRTDIAGEIDVAAQNGIAVLCKEEISEFYTNLRFSMASPDEVFDKIFSYVPAKPRSDAAN